MERKRILKDGSHFFVSQVGTTIVGLLNFMILTRLLSTEGMGQYSLLFMFVQFALLLGFSWSDSSMVRHGREEFIETGKVNKSFWSRMRLLIPFVVVFILLFLVFGTHLTAFLGVPTWMIYLIISLFLLQGCLNTISYLYQSIDFMKRSAYLIFSQKLLYLLGIIPLLFFGGDLLKVVLILNLSFVIILIWSIIRFNHSMIKPAVYSSEYLKKIWLYSWPQLIGFSGLYVINYIDLYVIKTYMTLHDVGVYSVAYKGFEVLASGLMIANVIFFPLIVEWRSKKRFDFISSYLKKIPLITLGWLVLVIVGLFSSGFFIPLFFSSKYVEAIQPFNVLLGGTVILIITYLLVPIINAFDLVLHLQIINIFKAAINIVLDILLVQKMGIIGPAIATVIAYAVSLVLIIGVLYYKRGLILGWKK